jgi:hypothetical protein
MSKIITSFINKDMNTLRLKDVSLSLWSIARMKYPLI